MSTSTLTVLNLVEGDIYLFDITFTLTPLVSAVLLILAEVLFDGCSDYFRNG